MKLSVVTINLNNKIGLEDTIKSVLFQTYKEVEFIIIDGGSSDGSMDVISKYSSIISYWSSEPDKGIYDAMNKGICRSNGDYILFLNSGDELYSESVLGEVFKCYHDEDILSGKIKMRSDKGNIDLVYPGLTTDELTLNGLLRTSLNHQATFIKRILFHKYGFYDESYKIISDWIFFIKTLIINNVSYLYLNMIISVLQYGGISYNTTEYYPERIKAIRDIIPPRIYLDYENVDIHGLKKIKRNKLAWILYLISRKIAALST